MENLLSLFMNWVFTLLQLWRSYFVPRMEEQNQPQELAVTEKCPYLPQHVVRDILLRVPVKSLVRFKCVCKEWFDAISDPDFAEAKLQASMSKLMIVCWISKPEPGVACSYKLEDKGMRARKLTSLGALPDNAFLLDSSNDLLLFTKSLEKTLWVYDAISHKQKPLPCLPRYDYHSRSSMIFSASGQKYKVIVFLYGELSELNQRRYIYTLDYEKWWECDCEEWRELKSPHWQRRIARAGSSILVRGIVYWMVLFSPQDDEIFIQPMDIATENFLGAIRPPCQPIQYLPLGVMNYSLLEMKESVCVVNVNAADVNELDIWVLKDAARSIWVKQRKVCLSSMVHRPGTLTSFIDDEFRPELAVESCSKGLTYILVHHNQGLYWYNLDDQKLICIAIESESENETETDSPCMPCVAFTVSDYLSL